MKDNTDHFVCRPRFLSNNLHRETCGNILLDLCIACEHCILGSNNLAISSARQNKRKQQKKNINFCPWLLLRGVIIFLLLERTETLGILQLVDVFYGVAEPRGSKHIKRYICIVHWISIKWWAALTTFKSILPRSSLRWKNLEVRRLEISSNLVS